MFKFEELNVYQETLRFIDAVYELTSSFPREELFSLSNQLHRSVTSIALNIAEGTSRGRKEFCHFLDVARGSCYESVANLTIAKNRKYISEEKFRNVYQHCEIISKMLSKLKTSIQ